MESYCHFFLNYCYINPVCLGFESPTALSPSPSAPAWQGRRVASSKLWMLEFSAFLEQQQDQDTVRNTPCFHPSLIQHPRTAPVHHGCVILLYVYGNTRFIALQRIERHPWETADIHISSSQRISSNRTRSVQCASGLPIQDHGHLYNRAQGTEVISPHKPLPGYFVCPVQPCKLDFYIEPQIKSC